MATATVHAAAAKPFRSCGACGQVWPSAAAFLDDAAVKVLGLQVAEHLPDTNLIVFEHACGSSVSVQTSRLRFLLPDPAEGAEAPDLFDSKECQGLCRRLAEWAACDRPCVNARDRHLLQLILRIKAGPTD